MGKRDLPKIKKTKGKRKKSANLDSSQSSLVQDLRRPDDPAKVAAWASHVRKRLCAVERQLRGLETERQMLLERLRDAPQGFVDAVVDDLMLPEAFDVVIEPFFRPEQPETVA